MNSNLEDLGTLNGRPLALGRGTTINSRNGEEILYQLLYADTMEEVMSSEAGDNRYPIFVSDSKAIPLLKSIKDSLNEKKYTPPNS